MLKRKKDKIIQISFLFCWCMVALCYFFLFFFGAGGERACGAPETPFPSPLSNYSDEYVFVLVDIDLHTHSFHEKVIGVVSRQK